MNLLLALAADYISPLQRLQKHVFVTSTDGPRYCLYSLAARPYAQEFSVVQEIQDDSCDFAEISSFTQIFTLLNVNFTVNLTLGQSANVSLVYSNYNRALEVQNCNFSFIVSSKAEGSIGGVAVEQRTELFVYYTNFRFYVSAPKMNFSGVAMLLQTEKILLFYSSWHGEVLAASAAGLVYQERGTLIQAQGNVVKFLFTSDGTIEQLIYVCTVAVYDDAIDYAASNVILCSGDIQRLNSSANGVCFNAIQSYDIYYKREDAYATYNTTADTYYVIPKAEGLFCTSCDELHSGPQCKECTDPGMQYLDGKCRTVIEDPRFYSDNCYYSREHLIYICQSCREGYALYDCSKCLDSYVKFEVCEPRCAECYGECMERDGLIQCKSCIQGFSIESFCKDCIENYSKINGICVPNVVCNVTDMVTPVYDRNLRYMLVAFTGNIKCSIINVLDLRIARERLNPGGSVVENFRISIIESDDNADVYEGKIINGSLDIDSEDTYAYSQFGGIFASQVLGQTITISHININLSVTIRNSKWSVSPVIADVSFYHSRYNIASVQINGSAFVFYGSELIFGGVIAQYGRAYFAEHCINISDVRAVFSLNSSGRTVYGSLIGLLYNASALIKNCSVSSQLSIGAGSNVSLCVGQVGHEVQAKTYLVVRNVSVNASGDISASNAAGLVAFARRRSSTASVVELLFDTFSTSGRLAGGKTFAHVCAMLSDTQIEAKNCSLQVEAVQFDAAYQLFYGAGAGLSVLTSTIRSEHCRAGGTGSFAIDGVRVDVETECLY